MKRGRPKKVGPIKDSELHIRMTKQEKEELRKKALEKNTTVSNYIKSILFGQNSGSNKMINPKYAKIENIFYLLATIEDGLEDDIKDESISEEKGDGYLSLIRNIQHKMSELYATDIHNAAYYRELYKANRGDN